MSNAKSIGTPVSPSTTLDEEINGKNVDETMYRGMVGSLLYPTASRQDIILRICKCAKYQSAPKESHSTAVKRTIRYLIGTVDYGLWYESLEFFYLKVFSDADFVEINLTEKAQVERANYLENPLYPGTAKNKKLCGSIYHRGRIFGSRQLLHTSTMDHASTVRL
ncbi:PREDICTED: uncharacterized protein LOC109240363 [Nicotiana attenuata]|uniref:uncharacterized protein LOC109240363 n=1 Tax=Nicotiana attenuata TaxID=49451 RepID=UPI0009047906|nr:PREDICTED: uncharacterized protein LOC109240363 [Nicotiana attenuata]